MSVNILVNSWKNFLNESINDELDYEGQYDIGLLPMSAKPFHEGHMSLIRKASDECKEVIVFVSTSDRKRKGEISIFGEDMLRIWEDILVKYLPKFETPVELKLPKLKKLSDTNTQPTIKLPKLKKLGETANV